MDEDIRIAGIQASRALAETREYTRIAEEYRAAVNARDLTAIGRTLHPDLHFVGPAGEVHGRESFLGIYTKAFADLEKLDRTTEALENNLVYFKYYLVLPPPLAPIQGTLKTTHAEDGLIRKIEMTHPSSRTGNEPNPQ
ncbi:MAG TPA: nuclear transport factor 2 family protein [bacterium]|nr:nuclear transport factor 2 family protein [bacterium]